MIHVPDSNSQQEVTQFGPRQRELLEGWRSTARNSASGIGYDFTAPAPGDQIGTRIDEFLEDPTRNTFADTMDSLRRNSTPYGYVLGQWPGGLGELAEFLDEVRNASEWNDSWTEEFRSNTWLYELFTRMHDSLPVVDSYSQQYLRRFGIRVQDDFESQLEGMKRFRAGYKSTIGQATEGTDHEVSINREIDELFALLHEFPKADIAPILLGREKPVHEPLIGFDATTHEGGRIEMDIDLVERAIDSYVEGVENGAYGFDDSHTEEELQEYWCGNYNERWKHQAADAVSTALRYELDGTALEASDLERVIDVFDEGHGVIDQPVIEYLLGPRQGWRVWGAFKERTRENPQIAAAVLSRFFNPEAEYITGRLELFRWYYGDDDALRAGSLMKLAAGLLMLVWPERYVLYQYGRCKALFDDVCISSFKVETGYNPDQYHRINAAAERLRKRLDERLDHTATMCGVQSIFYFWADAPLTSEQT